MTLDGNTKHDIDTYVRAYLKESEERNQNRTNSIIGVFLALIAVLLGMGAWALRVTAIDAARNEVRSDSLAGEVTKANIEALKKVQEAETAAEAAINATNETLNALEQSQLQFREARENLDRLEQQAKDISTTTKELSQQLETQSKENNREFEAAKELVDATVQKVSELENTVESAGSIFKKYLEDFDGVATDIANILLSDAKFQTSISNKINTIPTGAVLAFDTNNECPSGWELYGKLAGRVLVGADEDKPHGSIGGKETHLLTIAQMPPHDHGGIYGGTSSKAGMNNDFAYHTSGAERIQTQGGGQPFNIMPPYLATTFCVKR